MTWRQPADESGIAQLLLDYLDASYEGESLLEGMLF